MDLRPCYPKQFENSEENDPPWRMEGWGTQRPQLLPRTKPADRVRTVRGPRTFGRYRAGETELPRESSEPESPAQ